MKYIIILTIFISCTPPVDYFGNSVEFKKEIIYLTKFREDSLTLKISITLHLGKFTKWRKMKLSLEMKH